jgi:hypothetical protein
LCKTKNISSQVIGPGVEILAEGKIAVLPPSLHQSERHYEWEAGFSPEDMSPASVPDWLIQLTDKKEVKKVPMNGAWHGEPTAPANLREKLTQLLLASGGQYQADGRILMSCPFPDHQDKTPSFYYQPLTGQWWCFGSEHPGREPGRVCVSGSAHQLEKVIEKTTADEMLISVINEVFPENDYRNQQGTLTLEYVEAAYNRMLKLLEARLRARNWSTFAEMETISAVGKTLETTLEGFITDRRPGGIRVPCFKDGKQEYIHVFPQGCGHPLCPIHSQARAEENIRKKRKRLAQIREPAFVLFRSSSSHPREVVSTVSQLQRRKSYPLKGRSWYKLVLPYRPGAQVGVLIDLAQGGADMQTLQSQWAGEVALVKLPQLHLYKILQSLIRQADFPETYYCDEEYWLNWLLGTRGLQCARPLGAMRKGGADIQEDKPNLCPHGNAYGKPLGMLTPDQMEVGLSERYFEDSPFGLIQVRELPQDPQEPPGLHKWKDCAIKQRRQREKIQVQECPLICGV